ncbi:hypothetical protein CBR_g26324 [Chara braunii]|uniref:Amine oxidase domain-containing protein n=1 Tax=Chara braunii TaxID=69332 RepID=A0A388L7N9_CHABU|nr:hypothetical protein CBR_g26324 [Chara braunii]|eukprot:GBG78294.1 hypothetical protein CBR_g26324 [Chara braunii]
MAEGHATSLLRASPAPLTCAPWAASLRTKLLPPPMIRSASAIPRLEARCHFRLPPLFSRPMETKTKIRAICTSATSSTTGRSKTFDPVFVSSISPVGITCNCGCGTFDGLDRPLFSTISIDPDRRINFATTPVIHSRGQESVRHCWWPADMAARRPSMQWRRRGEGRRDGVSEVMAASNPVAPSAPPDATCSAGRRHTPAGGGAGRGRGLVYVEVGGRRPSSPSPTLARSHTRDDVSTDPVGSSRSERDASGACSRSESSPGALTAPDNSGGGEDGNHGDAVRSRIWRETNAAGARRTSVESGPGARATPGAGLVPGAGESGDGGLEFSSSRFRKGDLRPDGSRGKHRWERKEDRAAGDRSGGDRAMANSGGRSMNGKAMASSMAAAPRASSTVGQEYHAIRGGGGRATSPTTGNRGRATSPTTGNRGRATCPTTGNRHRPPMGHRSDDRFLRNGPRTRSPDPDPVEQVRFDGRVPRNPTVGIIGGGLSGILCALTLAEHGIRSTVFDTGKHGLGGRMATRHVDIRGGHRLVFDHAAQFFTVSEPRFQRLVDDWLKRGIVREWEGVVGKITVGGSFQEEKMPPPLKRYVGSTGMRDVCDRLLERQPLITVRRPVWIGTMEARGGKWALSENGREEGEFDFAVIAHNGKCANRLLKPAGVPFVYGQMKRLELSAIWALLAAFQGPLPMPAGVRESGHAAFDGAFVDGIPSISWMGNNTTKLMQGSKPNGNSTRGGRREGGSHCWTFFSTAAFGRRNKVPQENIPPEKATKVLGEMLKGVAAALGVEQAELPPMVWHKLQLWGAGLPLNSPKVPCIFDPVGRAGICGDWLMAPSLEAAALSGQAMGRQIMRFCEAGVSDPGSGSRHLGSIVAAGNGGPPAVPTAVGIPEPLQPFAMGLSESLRRLEGGHDIGLFPHP